jgi:transcriptional regulator with XRE-family HTH domain
LTQEELGEQVDPPVAKTTIWKYEHGVRVPNIKSLRRLAEALGVKVGDLINVD